MASDLRNDFQRAITVLMDTRGKPAVLGKVDGTLYFTDDAGTRHRDRVWARVGEGESRQETVVYLNKVSPQYGLPVRVDLVNGVNQVIDTDGRLATIFGGGLPPSVFSVPAHWKTHNRLGPDPGYIEGLQFLPLQAHPTNPASMAVTVEQGSYRWQGADEIFETTDSSDLSAYIPGSSAVNHFIILCLNRSTGALVEVDGDDISTSGGDVLFGTGKLTAAAVQTVLDAGLADEYWPLCAILFYNGMTSIKAKDIVFDLRPHGGEGGAIQAIGSGTDNAIPRWDGANGDTLQDSGVTVDDSNNVTIPGRILVNAGDITGVGIIAEFRGFRTGTANAEFYHTGNFSTGNEVVFNFPLHTDNASANQKRTAVGIHAKFTTLTDASRTSQAEIRTADNGTFAARLIVLGKRVGIDATPATSAKLEVGGTDGAVLLPRLTTTQRDALTAVAGMILFNSSTSKFQGYDGSSWVDLH